MSNVTTRQKGNSYQLRFRLGGNRCSVTVTPTTQRALQDWQIHLAALIDCHETDTPRESSTSRWLAALSTEDQSKLARCGLIAPPPKKTKAVLLSAFADRYFASLKPNVKSSTSTFHGHTHKRLNEFFAGRTLESITVADAQAFRDWLSTSNRRDKNRKELAANTIRRRTGLCRQLFNAAIEEKLVTSNPFKSRTLPASATSNADRQEYISMEDFARVLKAAPNARWRALLVLARIAGLRMPSEVAGLWWSDIAFDANRMIVHSPKTEHHAGQESRIIPLFPAVRAELEKLLSLQHLNGDDQDFVFPGITPETNLRTKLLKIVKKAGLKQWPKAWQNLRASAATDLVKAFPVHVATKICGHCEEIAKKHYWMATEEDFDRAVTSPVFGGAIPGVPVEGVVQNIEYLQRLDHASTM